MPEFSMLLLFAVSKQKHDLINHTENINMYLFTVNIVIIPTTEFYMLLLFAVSKQELDWMNHTENMNMYLFTLILSESPAPGKVQ